MPQPDDILMGISIADDDSGDDPHAAEIAAKAAGETEGADDLTQPVDDFVPRYEDADDGLPEDLTALDRDDPLDDGFD